MATAEIVQLMEKHSDLLKQKIAILEGQIVNRNQVIENLEALIATQNQIIKTMSKSTIVVAPTPRLFGWW